MQQLIGHRQENVNCGIPASPWLPHSGHMLIVDWITMPMMRDGHGRVTAELRADGPYFSRGRFHHYWYVEFMAQAVAALYSHSCKDGHRAQPSVGYLVKIDSYDLLVAAPPEPGDVLRADVKLLLDLHPFGHYAVNICLGASHLAEGELKFLVEDGSA